MSENIVHTGILDDCFRLMANSDEICESFKEAAVAHRDFARLGTITRWGDRFTVDLLSTFRERWASRSDDDQLDVKLAFVLGWPCHRATDRQMKPVFREAEPNRTQKPSECSIYHEAFVFHEVFQSGRQNPYHEATFERSLESLPAAAIDVEATEELLRVIMQRALIEMHTFIPDAEDIEGWFERLFARQQRFYVDLERYAAAITDPDPAKVKRFITDVNFYGREDPIIAGARAIQCGEAIEASAIVDMTRAPAASHYGRALQLGFTYLLAASDYFIGAIDRQRLYERLDIGKLGRDGIGV